MATFIELEVKGTYGADRMVMIDADHNSQRIILNTTPTSDDGAPGMMVAMTPEQAEKLMYSLGAAIHWARFGGPR